jgi:YVTN family beta-propeller protein
MMTSDHEARTRPAVGKSPVAFAVASLLLLLPKGGCSNPLTPERDGAAREVTLVAGHDRPARARQIAHGPTLVQQQVVKEGINVAFSVRREDAEPRDRNTIREGDDVLFQFKLTDTNGVPLSRLYPAAWLDLKEQPGPSDRHALARRVQKFLGGGLFARAELDLNTYYVLALNDDPSVTVVDPLFGFGGTKLLALVKLGEPGMDWTIAADQRTVFVAMMGAKQVAAVDTTKWEVSARVDVGGRPTRIALQPDQSQLWVACDAAGEITGGVRVVTTDRMKVAAVIPTAPGPHDLAVSDDSSWVFVTSAAAGTVTVVDARTLRSEATLRTGSRPVSAAYSPLARMAYIAHEDGTIAVVDPAQRRVVAGMKAEPGLGPIQFAPGGRYALAVNPKANLAHVVDASANRVVQTCDTRAGPDEVAFSEELAYVRHRGSEMVMMIPLKQFGADGAPLSVVEFFGGQKPPGGCAAPCRAHAIAQAPGEAAVLVANPADRAIYYYKEGLVAPMGHFSNYGRRPRAILCVDRSLRERDTPGVYQTIARVRSPGRYDLLFYLDAPRIVHAFDLEVEPDPERQHARDAEKVKAELVGEPPRLEVGRPATLCFRIAGAVDGRPKAGLEDVTVLTFLAPGIWHKRHSAHDRNDGNYVIDFTPPRPGVFYVSIESPTAHLATNDSRPLILRCADKDPGPETVELPGSPDRGETALPGSK